MVYSLSLSLSLCTLSLPPPPPHLPSLNYLLPILHLTEKAHSEELHLLLVESEGGAEMLSVEVASLHEKVASLEEECQDRCRMANEWYEALRVSWSIVRVLVSKGGGQ